MRAPCLEIMWATWVTYWEVVGYSRPNAYVIRVASYRIPHTSTHWPADHTRLMLAKMWMEEYNSNSKIKITWNRHHRRRQSSSSSSDMVGWHGRTEENHENRQPNDEELRCWPMPAQPQHSQSVNALFTFVAVCLALAASAVRSACCLFTCMQQAIQRATSICCWLLAWLWLMLDDVGDLLSHLQTAHHQSRNCRKVFCEMLLHRTDRGGRKWVGLFLR